MVPMPKPSELSWGVMHIKKQLDTSNLDKWVQINLSQLLFASCSYKPWK